MTQEKEVKFKFTAMKVLNYGAIAAVIVGLLWGILAAAGAPDGYSGTAKFAMFLEGFFFAIVGGAILVGLAEIVSRKQ